MKRTLFITFASLFASLPAVADINWDGDNSFGNFSYNNNWYGNNQPGWGYASGNLVFNFNNAGSTSLYFDYGGWRNISDIIFENTWSGGTTWNGDGGGINFNQRLENRSSAKVTIGSMNLSGAKNGAARIELNPVNGDLELNGNLYNDNNKNYSVFGANGKTLTLNTALGGTTATFTIAQNSIVVLGATQALTGATNVRAGRLELTASGGVGGAIAIGHTSGTDSAELRLTDADGGYTENANISFPSGSTGQRTISSTNTSGVNTLSGTFALEASPILQTTSGGTLELSGVASGTGTLTKTGNGTLRLSGSGANTWTNNILQINAGTVELNKTGAEALTASSVVNLAANTTVKWLTAGNTNGATDFNVGQGAVLDLNGFDATFAFSGNDRIALTGGTVQTGAGTWTFGGNNAQTALVNGSTVSTITGNVKLNRNGELRKVLVSDNAVGLDFDFAAKLTDVGDLTGTGLEFALTTGDAETRLSGDNTFRGAVLVGAANTVILDHPNALGATAGLTTVSAGGTIALRGGLTYAPESIHLAFNSVPGLRSISGNNVWTGTITNPGGASNSPAGIRVDADTLTFTGTWGSATNARPIGKFGPGAFIDNATATTAQPVMVMGGVYANAVSGRVNTKSGGTFGMILNGGTIAAPDNITMGIGHTGNFQRFGANGGGWAAYGADIDVNVSNYATLVWGGATQALAPSTNNPVGGVLPSINATSTYFGGAGYAGSETVTVAGSGGSGAAVTPVFSGGVITGYTLTSGGTGYTAAPTLTVSAPAGDGGTPGFLSNGAPLILNSSISAHKVTLKDALDLGASGATFTGQRVIQVMDNPSSANDRAVIDTVISSSKSGIGINKTGPGLLELTKANTYAGPTTIFEGTLLLSGAGSLPDAQPLSIQATGILDISQVTAAEVVGRLSTTAGSKLILGDKLLEFGDATDTTFTAAIESTPSGTLRKNGGGTLTLSSGTTFNSSPTIEVKSGTLLLGASHLIPNASSVLLSGGTLAANGASDVLGTLLVASNSALNFGTSGNSVLSFADSSLQSWAGTLTVLNWAGSLGGGGLDQLLFANSGLSAAQLASVTFVDPAGLPVGSYGASFVGNEIVPVPESKATLISLLLATLVGRRELSRRRK
jgi:fibronectin-binding autotransporter adhesin